MTSQVRLYSALFTLSIIWGMSFLFIKVLLDYTTPFGVVFYRCLFGAISLVVIILLSKERIDFKKLPYGSLFIVGLLNAAIPWALISFSELKISSSMASVINATTPLWTAIIGFSIFAVKLNKMQIVGILTGFIGILYLLKLDIQALFTEDFIGVGTMLVATVCYGLSSHYTKRNLKDVSVKVVSLATLIVGGFISFIASLFYEPLTLEAITTPIAFWSFIALGVFGSGIAYLLFYYCIKEGSAEFATLVTYLVPVTAILWGYLLLNEQITSNLLIGLVLIFLGVYLSGMKKRTTLNKQHHLSKQN
jgi:drug/metabolite transporter (DMT)-like permease